MIAWFLVPYNSKIENGRGFRWCAMDEFTTVIRDSGGDWQEVEIAGDQALVKVRATAQVMAALRQEFKAFPKERLREPLAGLPAEDKAALSDLVSQVSQLTGKAPPFNDVEETSQGGLFRFLAGQRRKPRLDNGQIVFDGELVACESVDILDARIR